MAEKENAFLFALKELGGGTTLDELNTKITELLAAVQAHGKPGTITLTIKLTPKPGSPQILVSDDVKVVDPKPERDTTVLYADDKHNFSRRDPRQPRLPVMDMKPRAINDSE